MSSAGKKSISVGALTILVLYLPFLVFGSGEAPRVVDVSLALEADCGERDLSLLRELIMSVSHRFDRKFSIRFRIGRCRRWLSESRYENIDDLFPHFFKTVPKGDADFVVGMTCDQNLTGKYGISYFQGGYVLLRSVKDPAKLKRTLMHEICHLFGATHLDNHQALMDRFLRGDTIQPDTRAIIRLHKDRDFRGSRFPLSPQGCKQALVLYRKIAGVNESRALSSLGAAKIKKIHSWLQSGAPVGDSAELRRRFARLEDVYLSMALIQIEMKEYDAVIDTCARALRINPDRNEAYNLMGISSRRSGRIGQAIDHYRTALRKNPSYLRIYFNLGIAYMEAGRVEEAERAYRQAVTANPHFAEAWNNLGYLYLERDDVDAAIRFLETAIGHNPYLPLAHSNLAEAYIRTGEIDRALASVRKALCLNPDLPGPHNILGKLYVRRGNLEAAESEYRQAVALDTGYHKGYYNLGNLYLRQKRAGPAGEHFKTCIAVNPKFIAAFAGLGDAYLLEGRMDEAEAAFQKAIRLGYLTPQVYVNLSFIRISTGDFANAAHMARQALEMDPQLAEAGQNLGIALFRMGRVKEAKEALARAVEINPQLADSWAGLGHLHLQAGKLTDAVSCYSRCLEVGGANGRIHNNMAVALYLKRDFRQALIHLQEAEKCGFKVNADFKKKVNQALGLK